MRINSILLCCQWLCIVALSSAHAGTMGNASSVFQWVASFSLGPGWYQTGSTQNLLLQPGFTNTYVANQDNRTLITGELFLGTLQQLSSRLWGQIGIAGALASPARVSGIIWETGDPHLDNFTYAYHIDHAQVSLKGKLLTLINQSWYPYLSASLGAAFNTSTHYTSTPLLFEIIPIPPFTKKTMTSFAYTVGVGLQKTMAPHWQLGFGYEFADWGQNQLGPIAGLATNSTPGLNHLYVNQLMFNITFLS